jgi:hypothetical protein
MVDTDRGTAPLLERPQWCPRPGIWQEGVQFCARGHQGGLHCDYGAHEGNEARGHEATDGAPQERYDLSNRPAQGVTMSRGKPIQEGVRVKLPPGMTWERLTAMSPDS